MKNCSKAKNKLKHFFALLLMTVFLIFLGCFWEINQANTIESQYQNQKFPVVFNGKNLFYIQRPNGSLSAEERAEIISERIEKIAKRKIEKINHDDFDIDNRGDLVIVLFERKTLATVTAEDEKIADISREILANQYLNKIEKSLAKYQREQKPFYWIFGIVSTVVTTLCLILVLKAFDRFFPYTYQILDSWRGRIIPSIRIQNLEILTSENLTKICQGFISLIRIGLTLIVLYLFIPSVLSFFPKTRQMGRILFEYLMRAINLVGSAFVSYLPNIFILTVIIYLTHYTLRFLKFIFREIEQGTLQFTGFYSEWAQPTYRLLTWLIIALSAVFAFPYLPGFNSPAFKGVSAFLALLFTLGSTGVVSNTVSGFVLIYTRAFQVGDRVKIGDATGDILEKTLLVTRIKTIKNVVITIPNSVVISSNVVNYSALSRDGNNPLIIHTTITLGYDVPWRKVHEVLIAAAKKTQYIIATPSPFVFQTALNDFYVSYEINAYTHTAIKMGEIYSSLHQNIQDQCNEAEIEILSPHYSAIRDGNQNTIPENYLPKDYTASGFRVQSLPNLINVNGNRNHNR